MNRLSELKENRKLDNKGFSLVELIIVIAIMAVLIGVLAPQYLKYVEKSRQSADLDNYETILSAIETYAADPLNTTMPGGSISVDTNGKITDSLTPTSPGVLKSSGITAANVTIKSTKYKDIKIELKADADGYLEFVFTNAAGTATTNASDLQKALGR